VLGCKSETLRNLAWPLVKQNPIKRCDVRLNSRGAIITLPVRGCRARRRVDPMFGSYLIYSPVKSLWLPLVRRLKVQMPESRYSRPAKCRVCRRLFLLASIEGNYSWDVCSDQCATTWNKTNRREERRDRAAERRKAKSHRTCAHCGGPLNAERKSKQYCSVRCRVAAHRAQG
jgi:hypothetical protein